VADQTAGDADQPVPRGGDHGLAVADTLAGHRREASAPVVLDAIFDLVRGGIAWAALPAGFPPAKTVYGLFSRWAAACAWQRIHDALRDRARLRAGRR
jgi:transposase